MFDFKTVDRTLGKLAYHGVHTFKSIRRQWLDFAQNLVGLVTHWKAQRAQRAATLQCDASRGQIDTTRDVTHTTIVCFAICFFANKTGFVSTHGTSKMGCNYFARNM